MEGSRSQCKRHKWRDIKERPKGTWKSKRSSGEGVQVPGLLGKLHLCISWVGPYLLNHCYIPDVVVGTFSTLSHYLILILKTTLQIQFGTPACS